MMKRCIRICPSSCYLFAGHNITPRKGPCVPLSSSGPNRMWKHFQESPSKERQWKNIENGAVAEESFFSLK
jgi:hypothetical protein